MNNAIAKQNRQKRMTGRAHGLAGNGSGNNIRIRWRKSVTQGSRVGEDNNSRDDSGNDKAHAQCDHNRSYFAPLAV